VVALTEREELRGNRHEAVSGDPKTEIHKQTRNSSCFGVAQSGNEKNHHTPKQSF
jgi:hypothetical protein